jgi:hypothetical protein
MKREPDYFDSIPYGFCRLSREMASSRIKPSRGWLASSQTQGESRYLDHKTQKEGKKPKPDVLHVAYVTPKDMGLELICLINLRPLPPVPSHQGRGSFRMETNINFPFK